MIVYQWQSNACTVYYVEWLALSLRVIAAALIAVCQCYCDVASGSYRSVIYYTTHNRHWQGL